MVARYRRGPPYWRIPTHQSTDLSIDGLGIGLLAGRVIGQSRSTNGPDIGGALPSLAVQAPLSFARLKRGCIWQRNGEDR